jgi:4'-phosphopantetheinyl transferase EntD
MLAPLTIPALDGLFEAEVRVRAGEIHNCAAALTREEQAIVAHAVRRRRQEFASGRLLAHELLAAMGIDRAPLLSDVDRTPIWPDGIVGSIAHSGSLCVVAVARSKDVRSIGVDVEPCEPLNEELTSVVCSADELIDFVDRGLAATTIFCIKEAVYKAWYSLNRVPLEFSDVTVRLDLDRERFEATAGRNGVTMRCVGSVFRRDGWILAGVALEADR